MRRIVVLCLGLVAVLTGIGLGGSCYTIPEPDCGFVCGSAGACPDNYTCAADNRCHKDGSPADEVCTSDGGIDAPDATITSPTVTSTTPANGATNVDPGAPLTATVDQHLMTVPASAFVVMAGATQIGGSVTYDNQATITFTPSSTLPGGTAITAQLTAAITSDEGAPLVPYSWSFTTIDTTPPTIASSTPLDMATNVADTTTIAVTFSEPVENVDTTSFTVAAGASAIPGTIAASGEVYTFTPTAALPAATVITVSFTAAITDLAGNALVPVSLSFTTL